MRMIVCFIGDCFIVISQPVAVTATPQNNVRPEGFKKIPGDLPLLLQGVTHSHKDETTPHI